MHRCLNVDEIVRLITCELVASEAEATAVAIACCHKNFEGPVLDTLWETQAHLLPLLKSLPRDIWNESWCIVSAPTTCILLSLNHLIRKTFKRLPMTLEWTRFRKYARRMRELGVYGTLETLSLEVFSVLRLCAVSEPLFPNLKILKLWDVTGEFISFIPLFLSPGPPSSTLHSLDPTPLLRWSPR